MRSIVWMVSVSVITSVLLLLGSSVLSGKDKQKYRGVPIIDQKVLREHKKLYDTSRDPRLIEAEPAKVPVEYIPIIERLGNPVWRWGRWVK